MGQYTEKVLGFVTSADGKEKSLVGCSYTNMNLQEFVIGPAKSVDQKIVIKDVSVLNCEISPGAFAIYWGVYLDKVIFENVKSKDSMIISTFAGFNNVIIKGRLGSGLWVRPDGLLERDRAVQFKEWARELSSDVDWMLDISEYEADHVEIIGLPLEKVRFNPSNHVVINKELGIKVDWSTLGFEKRNFWNSSLLRLKSYGVDSGIFGMPLRGNKHYERTAYERDVLVKRGLIDC